MKGDAVQSHPVHKDQGTISIKRAKSDLVVGACTGNSKLVLSAIRRGANVNAVYRGRPILIWAVQESHLKVIKILVREGASLKKRDDSGFTALDQAVGEGDLKMVKFLLKAGAMVDGRTRNGTPLHTACACRRVPIVKLLLEHGANPRSLDKDGRTPEKFTRMGKTNRADKTIRKMLAQCQYIQPIDR